MHHGHHGEGRSSYHALAQGLGWFSIGLGLVELLAPRRLGEPLGLKGQERLIQAYGLREIATGVAILASKNPAPWIWARVGGDALDIATLSSGLSYQDQRRTNAGLAIASVMGVTALDVTCAMGLQKEARAQRMLEMLPMLADMRSRSGFPQGVETARGVADMASVAPEYRVPEPLRPLDESRGSGTAALLAGPAETDVVVEAAGSIGGQDEGGLGLGRRDDRKEVVGIH
ncbi:MAG TPA: cyclase dehydrase [Mesorhizobium sp.]|jgi:hypothetical protein|nr:cyclase dehydrase [Mesorhizobium sp.]